MTKKQIDVEDYARAKESFRNMGLDQFNFTTQPITFDQLPTAFVRSEFRVKDDDVELHIFHYGAQQCQYAPWDLQKFPYVLYDALIKEFRLQSYPERVLVEYVPELNAWYVLIKQVASLKVPNTERFVNAIDAAGPGR